MNQTDPADIRILVVDDDANVARGTAHLLEQAGYTTTMAQNGVEALKAVQTFHPNLVLSDRDMPEMNGVEMCQNIKGDPALSDMFVILISGTYTQSDEQAAGLEAGADGYIARPIANRELAARVASFVRILRLNRALHKKNAELEAALAEVKSLSRLLPICSGCKKIRDDKNYWQQVDVYIAEHSQTTFSHGICPDCAKKYYPGMEEYYPGDSSK